jgi:sugar lactone lactonase YvrE
MPSGRHKLILRRVAVAFAAASAATAATAALATPTPAAATTERLPDELTITAPALHPEGVAWDPTRHALLVSSLRDGTVSVVTRQRTVRTLVADPRMVSTAGLTVDHARGRVLVAYGDLGLGTRSNPDPAKRVSGLGIFDLRTGRAKYVVDFAQVPGVAPGTHFANDVAVDPAGNAYVTDSSSDTVFKVDVHGRASVFARDPRFTANGFALNGIVWHPGGYLLTVNYTTGALFRIGRHADVREVALDQPIVGGDGLALRRDGSLIAVTNSAGGPGPDAVRTLRPADPGWSSAQTVNLQPWPVKAPSTVALTPYGAWVLSGRLEVLLGGGTADDFVLRRYL